VSSTIQARIGSLFVIADKTGSRALIPARR
jgi:hypothetical protein